MNIAKWIMIYVPIICIFIALFSVIFVLISWGIGFYENGYNGFHFELSSCKEMMIALSTGAVGVLMFVINSIYNSPKGIMPGIEEVKDNATGDIK